MSCTLVKKTKKKKTINPMFIKIDTLCGTVTYNARTKFELNRMPRLDMSRDRFTDMGIRSKSIFMGPLSPNQGLWLVNCLIGV